MTDNQQQGKPQEQGREEILKKHIGAVDGFHNLTSWHRGFIYKAMEEYANRTSSIPTEDQKDPFIEKHLAIIKQKTKDVLIDHHIGKMWGSLSSASIKYFLETGTINGGFREHLLNLMDAWKKYKLDETPTEEQKEECKGWRWEQIDSIIRNNVLIEKKTVEWCLSGISVLKTMLSKHRLHAGVESADALIEKLSSVLNNTTYPLPPEYIKIPGDKGSSITPDGDEGLISSLKNKEDEKLK